MKIHLLLAPVIVAFLHASLELGPQLFAQDRGSVEFTLLIYYLNWQVATLAVAAAWALAGIGQNGAASPAFKVFFIASAYVGCGAWQLFQVLHGMNLDTATQISLNGYLVLGQAHGPDLRKILQWMLLKPWRESLLTALLALSIVSLQGPRTPAPAQH